MTQTKNTPLRRIVAAQLAAMIATSSWAQLAPDANRAETTTAKPASEKKIPVETAPTTASTEDETIILSPFEVVSDNKGYFASNTMSGTRMNSKIEDLGQSITVMTKEQMTDFAMLDINDVFDYMASTEGINTYSQFETDRTGAVVDQVNLNPNNANRVRGIGNANIAFGNIGMTGRVPVDPLWMEGLELSRGPNANIFGLGLASGTVNQVPATANLSRNYTKVELRADSYEGWRAAFDTNHMLIKNKLAIRASYAYQHTGFIRKPAEEDARRLSLQVKAQPFKNTTLAASYFKYKNESVRPNYTTPRDYYTDWLRAGQPGWNPVTRLVTFADGRVMGNGNVIGSTTPYANNATPAVFAGADNRSIFQIGAPGQAPYWSMTRYTNASATDGTQLFASTDPFASSYTGTGLLQSGAAQVYTAAQQPLYNSITRPIDNRSIYDWTKINLAGNSKSWDDVDIYLAQIDQIILNTPKQTLAFQATYLREDSQRLENQPMGPASVNSNVGQVQVDVNSHNLDGSSNPYFARPFLRSSEPYLRDKPWLWNTGRAQAVYRFDFSQNDGWSKWLGTQQLLGYYEYKDQQNRQYTYRHSATALTTGWQQKYAALNAPLGNGGARNVNPLYLKPDGTVWVLGNYSRSSELYYVGNTPGGPIEYAPNYFPENASVAYVWGPSSGSLMRDVSGIGFTPSPDSAGGLSSVQTVIKTKGAVFQSTFFKNKLVGTYGLREDKVYDRNGVFAVMTPDLRSFDRDASDKWASTWREAAGKTKSLSVVARPFQDIKYLRSKVSTGSGVTKFLAEAASSFSPTYNKSDNFVPQGPAYDMFLTKLPNQTGISKDIGFWMTMMDGKLSIRYTHFDTKQLNLRTGDINTMAQRLLRFEGFIADDSWNLRKQVTAWNGGTATDAQIAAAIKMPLEQYKGLQTIATNNTYAVPMNSQSKGDELEINFNPTRNWTVSASVTKIMAINTAAGKAVEDYIAARMPIWKTLEDPRFTSTTYTPPNGGPPTSYTTTLPTGATGHLLWWYIVGAPFNTLGGYNNTNSADSNYASQIDAPMSVFRQLVGRPLPQQREYNAKFNTKYNLAGLTDHNIIKNISVGGSVRYTSKGAIGFYGMGYDPAKDLRLAQNKITELDSNRPIYSPAETYVDMFLTYNTKLFGDKVKARFQLNVQNVFEDGGGLQMTQAFLDGTATTYRIIDPRKFVLSASFDL